MDRHERTRLLDRIDREGATIGADIPESIAFVTTSGGEGAGADGIEADWSAAGREGSDASGAAGARSPDPDAAGDWVDAAGSSHETAEGFPLAAFVFEVKRRETVPPDLEEAVEAVTRRLRRERLARRQRLEEGQIPLDEGERLVDEIIGISRALDALRDLGSTDVEAEATAAERADQQRWQSFLRRALGEEDLPGSTGSKSVDRGGGR